MSQNPNNKKTHKDRHHNNHKRHHGHNRQNNINKNKNEVVKEENKIVKEEKKVVKKPVVVNDESIYTRNLEPLEEGYRLPAMTLFNSEEEEFNLNDDKNIKVYITIPTFSNKIFPNEVHKLETILKEFPSINAYLISNEPVYTQMRLSKPYHFEKIRILSDFKNREFARNTGTYIYELSLLVKSIFIVDKSDRILYVRYFDDLYSNFDLNEINKTLTSIFE